MTKKQEAFKKGMALLKRIYANDMVAVSTLIRGEDDNDSEMVIAFLKTSSDYINDIITVLEDDRES
jgi:hypothetical protein